MGHSLNWHLEYINEYIKDNPALDITDASKFGYLNAKTNPQYAFGAIIIKYAIDKLGFQKVLDLLQYSDKKISYKEVIEKELGINKSELNTFLKTYITEHLTVKQ